MLAFSEFCEYLDESVVKVVRTGADGKRKVSRVRDKKSRSRRATQTTGRSKADLKQSARKSAKSRRQNVSGTRKATRKRKITMRKRKSMLGK